jgi:hypothetical protein
MSLDRAAPQANVASSVIRARAGPRPWLGLEFSNTEHNPSISRRRDLPQADETLHRWKASTRCDEAAE